VLEFPVRMVRAAESGQRLEWGVPLEVANGWNGAFRWNLLLEWRVPLEVANGTGRSIGSS
jgi:hypothetical protein